MRHIGLAIGGHALLENRGSGIADARVHMSAALHVEERGGVIAGLENEGRGEMNGHGPRTGGGVWGGACMQGQRVEAGIGVTGHGFLQSDSGIVGYICRGTSKRHWLQTVRSTP